MPDRRRENENTGRPWSRLEVEACVADYLRMLTLELNGQRYNKTEHANTLLRKLNGRSRSSVEFKHSNISAVLLSLGYPYIPGYKPRSNVQALLVEVVEAHLSRMPELHDATQAEISRPATEVLGPDLPENPWVPAPAATSMGDERPAKSAFSPVRRDYLAQEARNRSLGRAGELFVVELEARRLFAEGKKKLADKVEHVAETRGDGLGYDVLSFESDGRERLIEVKTTSFGELTPFYVSRAEVDRSSLDAQIYRVYRLFDFRRKPRLFELPGEIRAHCSIEPITFLARLAGRTEAQTG